MTAYGQFCPVALASEVLAERWTFLVVRELLAGSTRFSDLKRGVPKMSATLLTQRLDSLEHSGVIMRKKTKVGRGFEYLLTDAGKELKPIVDQLGSWGQRWTRAFEPQDMDPALLMWDMHRRLDFSKVPRERIVIEFNFADAKRSERRFWILMKDQSADVCVKPPGYDTDLYVNTKVAVLVDAWLGRRPVRKAIASGDIELDGASALKRGFPTWLRLSVTAPAAQGRQV
jgi:DNA-binding HxlR family transcriptional regulator